MERYNGACFSNSAILIARILLTWLFIKYGWLKMIGFDHTVTYFGQIGAPLPFLAAVISVIVEFFLGISILVGFLTRPLALLFFVYTLGTALIGHHFWTLAGAARYGAEINFYKNVSIMGGFLLLYVTGAGRYAVDALFTKRA